MNTHFLSIVKKIVIFIIMVIVTNRAILVFEDINQHRDTWIYPNLPAWVLPFVAAFIVISIAYTIWYQIKAKELLKYGFITTVAHKLRTPLTHIKWASENLAPKIKHAEDRTQLNYIQSASEKLVELTTILMNISETQNNAYQYNMSRNSVSKLAEEVVTSLTEQFEIKKLKIIKEIEPDLYANMDESRIKFVMQTFVENAVHYTPEAGTVTIALKKLNSDVVFSVTDTGIGISADELPRLFHEFYRSHNARTADTEGMGIGLYMSKEIASRHGGKIWAYSTGLGKGSIFGFSLKQVE